MRFALFVPHILFKGPLPRFAMTVTGEAWRADPGYDEIVQALWDKRVEAAAARGHRLWDGTHYRLTHLEDIDGRGPLRLGTIPFRYMATYRALHEQHGQRGLAPFHHLSTAALLRTADGHYVFGKRAVNGAIDFIGGGLQVEDGSAPDFEHNIRKEIGEETGIGRHSLGTIAGLGIVLSTTSNVIVVGLLGTDLSRDGVLEAFAGREDDEMAEPVFVPEARIDGYLHG
ncbi:MAG TPA: hypothetical protein VJ476_16450, partial [Rhizomicrobium sp.]|nr:hypothetical protein [Rhizomicrobium sp.]